MDILGFIQGIQSADPAIRNQCESQLLYLAATQTDEFVKSVLGLVSPELDINVLQGVLLTLKVVIQKHWNAGFEQFQGPPISSTVKGNIRDFLIKAIAWPDRRIRLLIANLISLVGSVDYPDEWPDLLESIVALVSLEDHNTVDGAVLVLKDLISDTLSNCEFFNYGQSIMTALYSFISKKDNKWFSTQTNAVECYRHSIQFFLMGEDSQQTVINHYIKSTLGQWLDLFNSVLNEQHVIKDSAVKKTEEEEEEDDLELYNLKRTVLNTLIEVESAFTSFLTSKQVEVTLQTTIELLYSLCKTPVDEASEEKIDLILADISFIQTCVDSEINEPVKNLYQNQGESLKPLILCLLELSKADIPDLELFVSEEMDLSIEKSLRAATGVLITSFKTPDILSLVWSIGSTQGLTYLESSMYLAGEIIRQNDLSKQRLDSTTLLPMVSTCKSMLSVESFNEEITPRVIIFASLIASCLGGRIDGSMKQLFLDSSIGLASNARSTPFVQAACLLSLKRYAKISGDIQLAKHQETLFQMITFLAQDASEDTPTLLAEALRIVLRFNFEVALKSSAAIELLFTLASKDASNIELIDELSRLMAEIVESATRHDRFTDICDISVPHIVQGLNSVEYSPERALGMELLNKIIAKGPDPMIPSFVEFVLPPLHNIIMHSDDSELIEHASEGLVLLIEKAKAQLGTDLGLRIISDMTEKLLDPATDDSALLFCPSLLESIFFKYSSELQTHWPRILQMAIFRLNSMTHHLILEGMLNFFCSLVLKSPTALMVLLSPLEVNEQPAINILMKCWLGNFDILQGMEDIDMHVEALQKLYNLQSPQLQSVLVEGDLEVADDGVILTRSKTKNLKYKQISVPLKIVKLLLKELTVTTHDFFIQPNSKNNYSLGDFDSDDEWVDEIVDIGYSRVFDKENTVVRGTVKTHSRIKDWIKDISVNNIGPFDIIYNELTEEEKLLAQEAM